MSAQPGRPGRPDGGAGQGLVCVGSVRIKLAGSMAGEPRATCCLALAQSSREPSRAAHPPSGRPAARTTPRQQSWLMNCKLGVSKSARPAGRTRALDIKRAQIKASGQWDQAKLFCDGLQRARDHYQRRRRRPGTVGQSGAPDLWAVTKLVGAPRHTRVAWRAPQTGRTRVLPLLGDVLICAGPRTFKLKVSARHHQPNWAHNIRRSAQRAPKLLPTGRQIGRTPRARTTARQNNWPARVGLKPMARRRSWRGRISGKRFY